jgi:Zn-dependent oligopeptidase
VALWALKPTLICCGGKKHDFRNNSLGMVLETYAPYLSSLKTTIENYTQLWTDVRNIIIDGSLPYFAQQVFEMLPQVLESFVLVGLKLKKLERAK